MEDLLNAEESLPDIKSAYYDYKFSVSKKYIGIIILVAAVLNLLLLIPDLILAFETDKHSVIIARSIFSAILLVFYVYVKRINGFKACFMLIAACELLSLTLFLFVLMNYENPNMLIQAMGLITIVMVIFFIPIRWIFTLIIALLGEAGFIVCVLMCPGCDTGPEFWAAVVYISIAVLLCAISARNAELHQFREFVAKRELERISSTDYLTDAANRFKIMEEAEKWMDFCRRHDLPLSLVFIDVDNLKAINDSYGHLTGDFVLTKLAKIIRGQLRSSDILARWGGDEFILLLPNFDLKNATALTQRIKNSLVEIAIIEDMSVTCSFGVALMKASCSFEELVREADSLMYCEKKCSRAAYAEQIRQSSIHEMEESAGENNLLT